MTLAARTPEELETLLEDSLLLADSDALEELFEDFAVLSSADRPQQVRGSREIGIFVAETWAKRHTYLAEPRLIVQAGDTALVLGALGVNVVRQGYDGMWRYEILYLSSETKGESDEPGNSVADA